MCSSADGTDRVRRRPERANGVCWHLAGPMFVALLATAGGVRAQAPQLLEKYKCTFCHAEREAKTGPAFVEIAASYKGNAKAVDVLAAVVRKGSHGSGPWHMPPHPEVSEADARAMVRYILSLQE
jgi:cytochrome c